MEIEFRQSYFVYIVTDHQRTHFNVNITTDLHRIMAASNDITDTADASFYLIYCEQYHDKLAAVKRETELAFLPQRRLRKLVVAVNPGFEPITEPISLSES